MVDRGAASDTKLEDQPPVCYQGQFDNPICPECAPFASTHTPTTHAQIMLLDLTSLVYSSKHCYTTYHYNSALETRC